MVARYVRIGCQGRKKCVTVKALAKDLQGSHCPRATVTIFSDPVKIGVMQLQVQHVPVACIMRNTSHTIARSSLVCPCRCAIWLETLTANAAKGKKL